MPEINSFWSNNETNASETPPPIKQTGRPKNSTAEKKKHFNLMLAPDTLERLNKAAAQKQLETGRKESVTSIICALIDNYLNNEPNI